MSDKRQKLLELTDKIDEFNITSSYRYLDDQDMVCVNGFFTRELFGLSIIEAPLPANDEDFTVDDEDVEDYINQQVDLLKNWIAETYGKDVAQNVVLNINDLHAQYCSGDTNMDELVDGVKKIIKGNLA